MSLANDLPRDLSALGCLLINMCILSYNYFRLLDIFYDSRKLGITYLFLNFSSVFSISCFVAPINSLFSYSIILLIIFIIANSSHRSYAEIAEKLIDLHFYK